MLRDMMMQGIESMVVVAGTGLALYAGHHIGDYWVQTDHQAKHKGDAGRAGQLQCAAHVVSYLLTQAVMLLALTLVTGWTMNIWAAHLALLVSGLTHYAADRRERGLMFKLARLIPGKANFLKLGVPRAGVEIPAYPAEGSPEFVGDNPSLGTGAWALDQSWHILWGVFVPALILGAFA
jgi:hypothetical protein